MPINCLFRSIPIQHFLMWQTRPGERKENVNSCKTVKHQESHVDICYVVHELIRRLPSLAMVRIITRHWILGNRNKCLFLRRGIIIVKCNLSRIVQFCSPLHCIASAVKCSCIWQRNKTGIMCIPFIQNHIVGEKSMSFKYTFTWNTAFSS